MPRSALLCTKIEIREPAYTCDLKIECSERKRGAAAKMHFATAPLLYIFYRIFFPLSTASVSTSLR